MNLIWIRNVFLTSVITLTLLYLVLLAFEVFVATSRAVPQYKIENNFDLRTQMEVISDMRKEGKEAYPPTALNFWMGESLVSLAGISNVDTVLCNELGQYVVYRSDRYGFNNYDYVYDKEIDAVLIGDSFTQGDCVEQNESIMGNLNRMGLATISLGRGGSGPLRQYASYKEYVVDELEPEYVLWLYFEANDLYGDLQRERNFELLRKYLDDDGFSQNLSSNQDKIDNYIKEHLDDLQPYRSRILTMSRINSAVKLTDIRTVISDFVDSPILFRPFKGIDQETKDLFEKIILKMNSEARRKGERFIFVYLPTYSRYTDSRYKSFLDLDKEHIISFLQENNIEHLDFDEVISRYKDPLEFFPYREFGHYNPFGYQVLSNEIYNYIKAE